MPAKLVLSNTFREAHQAAKLLGFRAGRYRTVRNAGAIRGVRNAEVYILPSFLERRDRHAILQALRWAKTLTVIYVDPADLVEPADDPRGELTERQLEVAYRYHGLLEAARPRFVVTAVPDDVEPPASHTELVERVLASATVITAASKSQDGGAAIFRTVPDTDAPSDPEEQDAPSPAPEPSEDAAPAEKPSGRTRRRRCSTGEHLVSAEELDAHNATEHPEPGPTSAAGFFG